MSHNPGSGNVSDGFGGGWNPSFNTVPGMVPGDPSANPRRSVLASFGSLASFTLSPSGYVGVFAGAGAAPAMAGVGVNESVLPIELSSPDIFKRPDTLGDGGNQFVYGGQQPDGYLYVPGAITVTGGDQSDAQWLVDNNKIDMKVEDSTIGGVFTHGWAVAGSRILLDTSYTDENGMQASSFGWVFKGLPDNNSGFGNHEVNLYVQGSKSETAHIQTFFKGGDTGNFPDRDAEFGVTNWYHYYNQVYTSPADLYQDDGYNPDIDDYGLTIWYSPLPYDPSRMYTYQSWNSKMWIGPRGGDPANIPVFDLGGVDGYVRRIGYLRIMGINTYILTCAHEVAHKTLFQQGIVYPYLANRNAPPAGFPDIDGDNVNDRWEGNHHLDNTKRDTTDSFSSTYNQGQDEELLAEILGFKEMLAEKDKWQQDWADTGAQFKINSSPPPMTYRDVWQFHADVDGESFVAGSDYPVKTLADLSQEYPTVLSDLP